MKIVLCVCLDILLYFMAAKTPEISYMLQLALLEILSGIDIYICRIPTELLAAAGFFSALLIFQSPGSVLSVLLAILIGFGFYLFRKRIGIGLYDILLIVILGAALQDPVLQMKFTALILILWGFSGSIIGALKKRKDLSIPLVPLVTISYYTVQTLL